MTEEREKLKRHGLKYNCPSCGEEYAIGTKCDLCGEQPAQAVPRKGEGISAEQFYAGDWLVYRWPKDSAVFRFAEAYAGELRKERDALIRTCQKTESALASARHRFDAAMGMAGSRWEEWGERAMAVKDLLNDLELALKPEPGEPVEEDK